MKSSSPSSPPGRREAARRAGGRSGARSPARGCPPSTRRDGIVEKIHGREVRDPYRWLEAASTDETHAWLAAQDACARRFFTALRDRPFLEKRLSELSYLESISPPTRRGRRWFFSRQHADREKAVHYYREGERGKPRVLIDPNTLSDDGSVSVRDLSVSWDGRLVAYKISQNASDTATLHVMEVGTRRVLERDMIEGARYAVASWTPRGDGFYYTRLPVDKSIPVADLPGHAAVYFHRIGQDPQSDELVHEKTSDPTTFIQGDLSRDGRYLLVTLQHGWRSSDLYLQDMREAGPRSFHPLVAGTDALYSAFFWKGRFYVHTNEGAPRYRIFTVDPRKPERASWRLVVPEDPEAVLDEFSVVGGRLALLYLRRASSELRVVSLEGRPVRTIELPNLGTASVLHGNPEDDIAYYSFSSPIDPPSIFRTSLSKGGQRTTFKVKLPLDPSPFAVEQVSYPSRDGTRITMFIVRRRGTPLDGKMPFILTGYGGFSVSQTPTFSSNRFVWLERGGGVAIPNLRGGGEYGEAWHRAGMLKNKQNVFDDFLAAAEHLVEKGYTTPGRLAIWGGSNGGLLVGAAMTQRPELFKAVVCAVPLLDMVRYHLFGSGKTWISEYGSADDPELFETLLAYSPYHAVRARAAYPSLLMMTADSDDRVDPMHARKFAAAVQHATTSKNPVLLRLESNAGHGGGDLIKKQVQASADIYAFLMHELGL
jgi:prolyl oligopeptidase